MASDILTKKFAFDLLRQTEGTIEVTVTYILPYCIEELRLSPPSTSTPIREHGFNRTNDGYEWDGETPSPSVTFQKQAKDSSNRFGGYSFTDTGSWAITQKPQLAEPYTAPGHNVRIIEKVKTQDHVAASADGNIVYIGPYEEYRVGGSEQRIRFVVPEAASLSPSRHSVRQTLKYASEDLHVGARSDEVIAVVAPGDQMSGLLAGLQSGRSGFWVKDTQKIATPHNTWIHEYIHTRQDLNYSKTTRWIIEGSANYYAALLAYRQRLTTYDKFHDLVSTSKDEHAVLAEPDRWPSPYTDYKKGSRVLAALDAEIRLATDGENTLESVFWKINRTDDRLTHPRLTDIVETVGNESLGSWLDKHARSTSVPDVPHKPDLFEPAFAVPVRGQQPVCPFCDAPANGRFCAECGTELDAECDQCRSPITGNESFCAACGAEL
jgi:hypothetical protein